MKDLAFEKLSLGEIEKCYSTLGMEIEGKPQLFFGGEGVGFVCAYSGENFDRCDVIWEGGGGTMSIVPMPGHEGWLLASRGFRSMVDCGGSTIEIIRRKDGKFSHEPIATVDYLHRFDTLLAPDGTRYIIAASLHSGKENNEDWSTPGYLYAGVLPEDVESSFTVEMTRLPGELYMNHGFCKAQWKGRDAAFISSREGLFVVLPPEKPESDWCAELLLPFPVSDIAIADVDGDGEMEIAALLPFHGDQFKIYHREKGAGAYQEVYSHISKNDFYHAIISGKIQGERLFAVGARGGAGEVFLVRWDAKDKAYVSQLVESGPGCSNLSLLNTEDGDLLLSANRTTDTASVYKFKPAKKKV